MAARFTSRSVDAFQSASPCLRFTQTRGAIVAIQQCRMTRQKIHVRCAGSPWTDTTPPSMVLDIDAFSVLGSIGEPLHAGPLRAAGS